MQYVLGLAVNEPRVAKIVAEVKMAARKAKRKGQLPRVSADERSFHASVPTLMLSSHR